MSGVSGDGFRMGDSGAVSWTGKVMVAAIIVLFVAVVFVIILHLYARWFWRRNDEASRRRRRHFVFATDVDPAAARHGLDTAVLQSLPVVVYQSAEFKDGLECSVCLCELADGEKARVLPKCNHGFHLDCIDMWFQSHSTCPLCRSSVGSELSATPSASEGDGEGVSTAEMFAFPTNVLFWGRPEEGDDNPSSSSARLRSHIVIDIPRPVMDGNSGTDAATTPVSPSSGLQVVDELKSPTSRLDSLRRLLTREGRLAIPISPRGGGDVEQGSRADMKP